MVKALVIDDEEGYREILSKNLRNAGCQVYEAATGREALDLLLRHMFHLATIDISLGADPRKRDIEGLVLLKKISALQEGTHCLLLSAVATKERERIAGEFEGTVVLRKQDAGFVRAVKESVVAAEEAYKLWREARGRRGDSWLGSGHPEGWLLEQPLAPTMTSEQVIEFCDEIVSDLVPLATRKDRLPTFDHERRLMVGSFWSRGLGCAVEVGLGSPDAVASFELEVGSRGEIGAGESVHRRMQGPSAGERLEAVVICLPRERPRLYETGVIFEALGI